MTPEEVQIAMAKAYSQACLRSALDHQTKDKGGFSEAQNKAWLDYDESLAILSKLYASKN
jgi:hypothetical protein